MTEIRTALLFAVASRQLAIETGEAGPTTIHAMAMRGLTTEEHQMIRGYVRAMASLNQGVKK